MSTKTVLFSLGVWSFQLKIRFGTGPYKLKLIRDIDELDLIHLESRFDTALVISIQTSEGYI